LKVWVSHIPNLLQQNSVKDLPARNLKEKKSNTTVVLAITEVSLLGHLDEISLNGSIFFMQE
jgi:hypothetical protein